MGRFIKFLRLPSRQRRLLIQTGVLLAGAWLGLRLLSFQALYRLAERLGEPSRRRRTGNLFSQAEIGSALGRASRFLFRQDPCLPQALAGYALFNRNGCPVAVRLGTRKQPDGSLKAHAWLEDQSSGEILAGGPRSEIERYTPLAPIGGGGE